MPPIGGARRDEDKSRAKERIFSFRNAQHRWDPKRQRPEPWRLLQRAQAQGRKRARVPAVELDRARHLALHPPREHSGSAAVFLARCARLWTRGGTLIMRDDERYRSSPAKRP